MSHTMHEKAAQPASWTGPEWLSIPTPDKEDGKVKEAHQEPKWALLTARRSSGSRDRPWGDHPDFCQPVYPLSVLLPPNLTTFWEGIEKEETEEGLKRNAHDGWKSGAGSEFR